MELALNTGLMKPSERTPVSGTVIKIACSKGMADSKHGVRCLRCSVSVEIKGDGVRR